MVVRVIYNFGAARVVSRPAAGPYDDNIFVQERVGRRWRDVAHYNSMSNDYAFTSARDHAKRITARNFAS